MKILITADPEIPVPPTLYGGIERIIDLLIRGLRAQGHEVGLVAHLDSTCEVDHFFPWPCKRSGGFLNSLRNTIALNAAIHKFQPDVVHSFSRLLYLLPQLMSSTPKIMSFQRHLTGRTIRWAAKLAGRSLTFTACSDHICQRGRQIGGTWKTIHNCVELDTYTFQPQVSADAPLVFLSRIERIKGAHVAIAAAQKTGRRLVIAGNQGNTPETQRYWQEEIEPHLGKPGIEYVGPVNDIQKNELLGQAAAMIVPVEWEEPFGIVFAEALACGTPVISRPIGSLPEIVRPGVDGYLVDSLEEACTAIQALDALDRHHCRQRAEQAFSASVVVSQYEQLYQQVCP